MTDVTPEAERPFTRIERDGAVCVTNEASVIVEEIYLHHLHAEDGDTPPTFSTIFLTQSQYDDLPEFAGW